MKNKRWLYYVLPFVVIPTYLLLFELLMSRNWSFSTMTLLIYAFFGGAILLTIVISLFSPSERRFDYLITALTPLAFAGCMFLLNFFDGGIVNGKIYGRFDLTSAISAAVQPPYLVMYGILALLAFGASYRKLRIKH